MGFNDQIIAEFRANNGRVGGPFEGADLVLLTTAGRRTGRPHTTPAGYRRDGDRLLVFGSNGGAPTHPHWYLNLLASAQVTVEIGTDTGRVRPFAARAEPLRGAERDREWETQCSLDPGFRDYAARTTRTIPVVALHPLDLSGDPERGRLIARQLLALHDGMRDHLHAIRAEFAAALAGEPPTGQPRP
ncbi:nitroreductase family deazaflavin-dependent oxidoreductase, partial [Streptomyces sp. 8K308]|uniref:nitroreductase family deazaflavin-dependent oxidoreductase n=1 Tax=Streptomyces sp. 8K308 TaxID=2530388 RepID=UPI00104ED232